MTFEQWWDTVAKTPAPDTFKNWEESCRQAWSAGVANEREACAKVCETGTTTLQHNHVNDGNPWETRNDPNGYCAAAIRLRHNVELTGAARLHRAASSDRRERG